jgi:hypothetical protein
MKAQSVLALPTSSVILFKVYNLTTNMTHFLRVYKTNSCRPAFFLEVPQFVNYSQYNELATSALFNTKSLTL